MARNVCIYVFLALFTLATLLWDEVSMAQAPAALLTTVSRPSGSKRVVSGLAVLDDTIEWDAAEVGILWHHVRTRFFPTLIPKRNTTVTTQVLDPSAQATSSQRPSIMATCLQRAREVISLPCDARSASSDQASGHACAYVLGVCSGENARTHGEQHMFLGRIEGGAGINDDDVFPSRMTALWESNVANIPRHGLHGSATASSVLDANGVVHVFPHEAPWRRLKVAGFRESTVAIAAWTAAADDDDGSAANGEVAVDIAELTESGEIRVWSGSGSSVVSTRLRSSRKRAVMLPVGAAQVHFLNRDHIMVTTVDAKSGSSYVATFLIFNITNDTLTAERGFHVMYHTSHEDVRPGSANFWPLVRSSPDGSFVIVADCANFVHILRRNPHGVGYVVKKRQYGPFVDGYLRTISFSRSGRVAFLQSQLGDGTIVTVEPPNAELGGSQELFSIPSDERAIFVRSDVYTPEVLRRARPAGSFFTANGTRDDGMLSVVFRDGSIALYDAAHWRRKSIIEEIMENDDIIVMLLTIVVFILGANRIRIRRIAGVERPL